MKQKKHSKVKITLTVIISAFIIGCICLFIGAQKEHERVTLQGKENIYDLENNNAGLAADYLEIIASKYHNRIDSALYSQKTFARKWIIEELINAGYSNEQIIKQSIFVNTVFYKGKNIILTVPGEDTSKQIIVGAHYDSDGDGDNGSGVALLLATAVGLKDKETPVTVKYIFFDAEEIGTLGSKYYVNHMSAEEKASTLFMINIDAIGYGDYCNIYGGTYDDETKEVTNKGAFDLTMARADELGFNVYNTDFLDGYFSENGHGPELDAKGVFTNPWTNSNPSPENFLISSPSAYPASDAHVFDKAGIEYIMFDSTNWYAAGKSITSTSYSVYYDTINQEIGMNGKIMNTDYDNLKYLEEHLPGRAVEHFNVFSPILSSLIMKPM